jgi:hypothetical protein
VLQECAAADKRKLAEKDAKAQQEQKLEQSHDVPNVKVDGESQARKLTHRVEPRYPSVTRESRVAGTVTFAAFITSTGRVIRLRPIDGPPSLVQAAASEGVLQWRYQQTVVNGSPATVETTISVVFDPSK